MHLFNSEMGDHLEIVTSIWDQMSLFFLLRCEKKKKKKKKKKKHQQVFTFKKWKVGC